MLIDMVDLLSVLLILLPLYPKTVEGYVYAVNLFAYTEVSAFNLSVYWVLFASIVLLGILQIVLTQLKTEKHQKLYMTSLKKQEVLKVSKIEERRKEKVIK